MKILFNCENCGRLINGREQYEKTGRVVCPCGFLIFQEPSVNVYKKERLRKDLAPLPNIPVSEWKKQKHKNKYEKKWKEEEKEKD